MVGLGLPMASQCRSTLSVPLARATVCPRWVTTSEAESCWAAEILRTMTGLRCGRREPPPPSPVDKIREKLLKPEVRQKGKEQVKEKARDSVLQLLNRLQAEQAQRNPSALSIAEKSENRFQ